MGEHLLLREGHKHEVSWQLSQLGRLDSRGLKQKDKEQDGTLNPRVQERWMPFGQKE